MAIKQLGTVLDEIQRIGQAQIGANWAHDRMRSGERRPAIPNSNSKQGQNMLALPG